MQFIPNYTVPEINTPFSNTNAMGYLVNAIKDEQEKRAQSTRLTMNAINQAMQQLDPGALISDQNTNLANTYLKDMDETITNAMMYQMNADGTFSDKKRERSLLGPQITNEEYALLMKKFQSYDMQISKLRVEEKIVGGQWDEYKENKDKYDSRSLNNFNEYWKGGKMVNGGDLLVPKPEFIDNLFSDPKFDPRNETQKQASITPDPKDFRYNLHKVTGVDEQTQQRIYDVAATSSPTVQNSLINAMITESPSSPTEDGELPVIYRVLASMNDPNRNYTFEEREQMEDKAQAMIIAYQKYGTMAPELADAAVMWGRNTRKIYRKIGAGSERRVYDESRAKEMRDKSEEKKITPVRRDIEVDGVYINEATDLNTTSIPKERRNMGAGFSYPKDSYVIKQPDKVRIKKLQDQLSELSDKPKYKDQREALKKEISSLGTQKSNQLTPGQTVSNIVEYYSIPDNLIISTRTFTQGKITKKEKVFTPLEGNGDILEAIYGKDWDKLSEDSEKIQIQWAK
jgi:hypothetical protein